VETATGACVPRARLGVHPWLPRHWHFRCCLPCMQVLFVVKAEQSSAIVVGCLVGWVVGVAVVVGAVVFCAATN
jgi:hypothetical protein